MGRSLIKEQDAFNFGRLPGELQALLLPVHSRSGPAESANRDCLTSNHVYLGDARDLLNRISANSVSLSVWSPPYFVGKGYESDLSFKDWKSLLEEVIALHFPVIKPGGFLVINIADILCFKDPSMPKVQAEAVSMRRSPVSRDDVLEAMREHPDLNRYQLAALLKCSEQTIDRRLNGNNIRGGKYDVQTRVKIVGGLVEEWALSAGFYPYDRRIWFKDAAWENSRWASLSYRSVDEFEYILLFSGNPASLNSTDKGSIRKSGENGVQEVCGNSPLSEQTTITRRNFPSNSPDGR